MKTMNFYLFKQLEGAVKEMSVLTDEEKQIIYDFLDASAKKMFVAGSDKKREMTLPQLFEYIEQLEQENRRLEESFQKATGAVAADTLPTLAEMRKVSEMCRKGKCDNCPYLNKSIKKCRFVHGADYWNFGGKDNEKN